MAFRVLLLEGAERDLLDIRRFVTTRDSPQAADRLLNELEAACARLGALPSRGNVPKELRALGIADYREIQWRAYRIIYRTSGSDVFVYCVLDGRRDMQSLLQRRLLR